MKHWFYTKWRQLWDKFWEGFIFGFGVYGFIMFGKWMGWFS